MGRRASCRCRCCCRLLHLRLLVPSPCAVPAARLLSVLQPRAGDPLQVQHHGHDAAGGGRQGGARHLRLPRRHHHRNRQSHLRPERLLGGLQLHRLTQVCAGRVRGVWGGGLDGWKGGGGKGVPRGRGAFRAHAALLPRVLNEAAVPALGEAGAQRQPATRLADLGPVPPQVGAAAAAAQPLCRCTQCVAAACAGPPPRPCTRPHPSLARRLLLLPGWWPQPAWACAPARSLPPARSLATPAPTPPSPLPSRTGGWAGGV